MYEREVVIWWWGWWWWWGGITVEFGSLTFGECSCESHFSKVQHHHHVKLDLEPEHFGNANRGTSGSFGSSASASTSTGGKGKDSSASKRRGRLGFAQNSHSVSDMRDLLMARSKQPFLSLSSHAGVDVDDGKQPHTDTGSLNRTSSRATPAGGKGGGDARGGSSGCSVDDSLGGMWNSDVARLARWYSGCAVGLVLGGGGARGVSRVRLGRQADHAYRSKYRRC